MPNNNFFNLGKSSKKESIRDTRRVFTQTQKNHIWDQQNGKCAGTDCNHSQLKQSYVRYDHKKGWADKGQTVSENGQALCSNCHSIKTQKSNLKKIDKKRTSKKSGTDLFKLSKF